MRRVFPQYFQLVLKPLAEPKKWAYKSVFLPTVSIFEAARQRSHVALTGLNSNMTPDGH
jgi:hypothetical protein